MEKGGFLLDLERSLQQNAKSNTCNDANMASQHLPRSLSSLDDKHRLVVNDIGFTYLQ
jgi:hypothetical protein